VIETDFKNPFQYRQKGQQQQQQQQHAGGAADEPHVVAGVGAVAGGRLSDPDVNGVGVVQRGEAPELRRGRDVQRREGLLGRERRTQLNAISADAVRVRNRKTKVGKMESNVFFAHLPKVELRRVALATRRDASTHVATLPTLTFLTTCEKRET
jgi:hypothetical protein